MMTLALSIAWPLAIAVIGFLLNALASNPYVKTLGYFMLGSGVLVCTLVLAHSRLTVG